MTGTEVVGGTVTEVTHPLVQHKLGLLRDVTTTTQMFRQLVNELTLLLTYEATKDLATETVSIETPLEWTSSERITGKKVAAYRDDKGKVTLCSGFANLLHLFCSRPRTPSVLIRLGHVRIISAGLIPP